MKGKHYNWYKRKILKRYPLGRTFLESGLVLEIRYVPQSTGKVKDYICILLHKGVPGPLVETKKLHLLTLEHFEPRYFKDLVKDVGLEYSQYFAKVRKFALEKFLMEQKDAKRFYTIKIKPKLNTIFENTYRQFNIGGIQLIRVIDFDFDNL